MKSALALERRAEQERLRHQINDWVAAEYEAGRVREFEESPMWGDYLKACEAYWAVTTPADRADDHQEKAA